MSQQNLSVSSAALRSVHICSDQADNEIENSKNIQIGNHAVEECVKNNGINIKKPMKYAVKFLADTEVTTYKNATGKILPHLNQFFNILKEFPEGFDDRHIVFYEQDEINQTRIKRGHKAGGVQLGQPGRNGTWWSGKRRNEKTWNTLFDALKNSGIDLSDEDKNRLFGDAVQKKYPMTMQHLNALRKYYDADREQKNIKKLADYFMVNVKKDIGFEGTSMMIIDTIQKHIDKIVQNIQRICETINNSILRTENVKKNNLFSVFVNQEDENHHVTEESLKEGLEKIIREYSKLGQVAAFDNIRALNFMFFHMSRLGEDSPDKDSILSYFKKYLETINNLNYE